MRTKATRITALLLILFTVFSSICIFPIKTEAVTKPGRPTISHTVSQNLKWKYSTDAKGNKYRCKYTRIKITWSKVSGADGYEVWDGYSCGKQRYAGAVYSYTREIKQINKNYAHNYDFKVRAYKNVNGERYYGAWSKVVYGKVPTGSWEYYR